MAATKSKINYWKIGVGLGCVAAIFLFGKSCGINSVMKKVGKDTTVFHHYFDTSYVPVPVDSIVPIYTKVPIPYKEEDPKKVNESDYYIGPEDCDTVEFRNLWTEHNTTKFFNDSIGLTFTRTILDKKGRKVKDTTIAKGSVNILDTLFQNRFLGRGFHLALHDTTINTTTELTRPRKFVLYGTGSVGFTFTGQPVSGGLGLGLQSPKQNFYQAELQKIRGIKGFVINAKYAGRLNFKNLFGKK